MNELRKLLIVNLSIAVLAEHVANKLRVKVERYLFDYFGTIYDGLEVLCVLFRALDFNRVRVGDLYAYQS